MRSRKGQAAMEFLMTYGWAILVVLAAIAALAYFGILNPGRFLPDKCQLPSGVACLAHKSTTTEAQIIIKNSLGQDMTNVSFALGTVASGTFVPDATCGSSSAVISVMNGGTQNFTMACTPNILKSGSKVTYDLQMNYVVVIEGVTMPYTKYGEFTTKVE